jgi:3-hydroxybutyryl-CoA dehydratase
MTDTHSTTDFQIGDRASLTRTVTEEDVDTFAELIGDFNPLHVDAAYAQKSRFGGRIAHGVFTTGLISAVLGNELPGPGGIYLHQEIDFLAPVYLGDTITAVAEVSAWRPEKKILTLATDVYNQDETHVASGKAVMMVERSET